MSNMHTHKLIKAIHLIKRCRW